MCINSFLELAKNVDLESENGSFGVFDLYFDVGSSELIYYKNKLYIPLMKKTSLQKEELSIYTLLRRKEHIKNGYLSEKNKEEAKSHSWMKDMYSVGLYMFSIKYLLETMGCKIKKTHRLYDFKQKKWIAEHVNIMTGFRKKASSTVESNLYKLINNGLFGKALMSDGKYVLNQ